VWETPEKLEKKHEEPGHFAAYYYPVCRDKLKAILYLSMSWNKRRCALKFIGKTTILV
jgi:hypothetical protein